MNASPMTLSVVIATYNRGPALAQLLDDLSAQTLAPTTFEVVVIDDGSKVPAAGHLAAVKTPFPLQVVRQDNAGAGAARDHGVRLAAGDVVVILDDDMRVAPDFLQAHLDAHTGGATLVLGHIAAAPALAQMPLYERFHARQLGRFVDDVERRGQPVHGISLCTGNMSMRRTDYLAAGGFDRTLDRSEDRELGVRLEKRGAKLAFCRRARSVHASDHDNLQVWMRRAFQYGVYDRRIALKHPDVPLADPWRFLFLISPISKPLMMVPIALPAVGERLARGVMHAAQLCDRAGLERLALGATTLTYGIEYFRGVRVEAGSVGQAGRDLAAYVGGALRRRAGRAPAALAARLGRRSAAPAARGR